MVLTKNDSGQDTLEDTSPLTAAKKRRIRRKKLQARFDPGRKLSDINDSFTKNEPSNQLALNNSLCCDTASLKNSLEANSPNKETTEVNLIYSCNTMSVNNSCKSKGVTPVPQTKKAARPKSNSCSESVGKLKKNASVQLTTLDIEKLKCSPTKTSQTSKLVTTESKSPKQQNSLENNKIVRQTPLPQSSKTETGNKFQEMSVETSKEMTKVVRSKDEVDRAVAAVTDLKIDAAERSREQIKAEREAKKLAKQAKKKGAPQNLNITEAPPDKEIINKKVADTLANIAEVVKEVQEVAIKVSAIKHDEEVKDNHQNLEQAQQNKSKAELKAERRAKQETQRAAKSVVITSTQIKASKEKTEKGVKQNKEAQKAVSSSADKSKKSVVQSRTKAQHSTFRVDWFEHLYPKVFENPLNTVPLNSELHPAIVKLGVQLSTGVVISSNARCVALLNAMKHVIADYKVPDKTEFARGLEAHLTASTNFLWYMREPNAAQINAMNFLRFQLTDLIKKNIEDDEKNTQAKKLLLGEIDKYIGDQIDKAGEAISLTVRDKISDGDTILTYGCSSLIEKIVCDAWAAGVQFRAVVVGAREAPAGREMLRRLAARRRPATYVDITALSFAMGTVDKVVVGASSVLMNGSVLGAAGTLQVALQARAHNVPLLVCCETHKFSERVLTDAFVYNELGNPSNLVDEESPLKDWRSRPNLNVLNLIYDVTPANLVTAVVTELDILPCTSAPVVHRIKLTNN